MSTSWKLKISVVGSPQDSITSFFREDSGFESQNHNSHDFFFGISFEINNFLLKLIRFSYLLMASFSNAALLVLRLKIRFASLVLNLR